MKYTQAEIKERRFYRLAQIIYDHWEEGSGMDTRYFEHPFVNDVFVVSGASASGTGHREHVVPRAYLRDQCMALFESGASISDVKDVLLQNLRIVEITKEEAASIDMKYKTTMPEGWTLGVDSPLARLEMYGINVI